MSATPRLRSGFPTTPGSAHRRHAQEQETPSTIGSISSAGGSTTKSPTLPLAPENVTANAGGSEPLIPLTVLDAPQQRFYAFALYVGLWGWKLYDWLQVAEDGDGSWSSFAKWIIIDFAYLFLLPELRIPWLELSQSVVTCVYMGHVVINWFLMFLVPVSQSPNSSTRRSRLTSAIRSRFYHGSLLSSSCSTIAKSPSPSTMSRFRAFSTTIPSSWESKSSTSCPKVLPC